MEVPPSKATSAAPETPTRKASAWARLHAQINHTADVFFYRLGSWVAGHAKLTVLGSTVFVVICCAGFLNFSTESNGEELWVPKASQAKKEEAIVSENFEVALNFARFLVTAREEGGSVLTKEALDIAFDLDERIQDLETSDGSTYADLCVAEADGVACISSAQAITRFWNNDYQTYQDSVETDADVLAAIDVDAFPDGQAVALDAIFGNSASFDDNGALTGAEAFMQSYFLREADDVLTWEADYQSFMADEVDAYAHKIKLTYFTGRSIDDALAASISGEIFLFAITYIIMILFVQSVLGRCSAGPVRRRTWLGLGGVFCVLAAGLAAYGLNSGFGVPFTSLVQVLPFILLGIGVDDMFVIVAAFDHTDPDLPVKERVALGLKRSGFSITYTSLTNFIAFMLGSTSSLPAVEYFCLYAGTAILFDFFLQVTLFVAFLTMDANRQKAGRLDLLCCFKSKTFLWKQDAIERGIAIPGTLAVFPEDEDQEPDATIITAGSATGSTAAPATGSTAAPATGSTAASTTGSTAGSGTVSTAAPTAVSTAASATGSTAASATGSTAASATESTAGSATGGTAASATGSTAAFATGSTAASATESTAASATGGTAASATGSTAAFATGSTAASATGSTAASATGGTAASATGSTAGTATGGTVACATDSTTASAAGSTAASTTESTAGSGTVSTAAPTAVSTAASATGSTAASATESTAGAATGGTAASATGSTAASATGSTAASATGDTAASATGSTAGSGTGGTAAPATGSTTASAAGSTAASATGSTTTSGTGRTAASVTGSTAASATRSTAASVTGSTAASATRTRTSLSSESDLRLGRLGMLMRNKYTPLLLSVKGKTLVCLGTALLLAAGIYGATQAKQGFDVIDLAPDGHFARDHTEASKKYALEYDAQYIPLDIYTLDVNYTDVNVQASIMATDELLLEQTYVQGPLQSWLVSFTAWASNISEYSSNVRTSGGYMVYEHPDTFYTALADFLDDDSNAIFESDIIYSDDGLIKMSRSEVFLNDITDAGKRLESMLDARHVADQSALEPEPFAFTQVFVLIEQFLVIYDELITNFILALAAVGVLSLLILGRIGIVALVCLTVAMIDVELLGFVYHYGLEVNGITVIQLVMAVGLVVDYTAHIVHYFLHQSPATPKDAQIANALGEVGPSVMLGAATTFLGVMPMAFASNFVFRVFFKIFILIIVFGFYHGIVVIPVALSLFPVCFVSTKNTKVKISPKSSEADPSKSQTVSETKSSAEQQP